MVLRADVLSFYMYIFLPLQVWRVKYSLALIRSAARELLTLEEKNPRRLFEGNALLRRLVRYVLLGYIE